MKHTNNIPCIHVFFRFLLNEIGTAKDPSRGRPAGAAPSGRP